MHSWPTSHSSRTQLALAEHNLRRAEQDLQRAVQRGRQSVHGLGSEEVAAFKHCAVVLLRSVASARQESAVRHALGEWRSACWALAALEQAQLRASAAEEACEGLRAAEEEVARVHAEAAARRRAAAQQAKWAAVEMQTAAARRRRSSLQRIVASTWLHRDLTRAFERWSQFEAAPPRRAASSWKAIQESKWALQVLHSERVQQAAQQRGWAMSNLVATISHLMLGQLGAAFHLWVYSSLGVREAEGEAGR
jgi:hypothetical protein